MYVCVYSYVCINVCMLYLQQFVPVRYQLTNSTSVGLVLKYFCKVDGVRQIYIHLFNHICTHTHTYMCTHMHVARHKTYGISDLWL